jgi:hypothetical protein
MADYRKQDPRNFVPSQSTGVDPDTFVQGEASKDSLIGKNVVKETKGGSAPKGGGNMGGRAS